MDLRTERRQANVERWLRREGEGIVGTIENSDSPALRETLRRTPEKIVIQLLKTRMFKTENLTALRIDSGHHMLDRAVFTGGVHCLKDQQRRVTVRRIEQIL